MKIAVPARDNFVDGHFGHCEKFLIFSIDENKKITEEESIEPPPGCGCKSDIIPQLVEKGVTVLLAGNMGQGAVVKLQSSGINVVRGCAGEVSKVVQLWTDGKIKDSGAGCSGHGHDHTCEH